MDDLDCSNNYHPKPINNIIKRQYERKKAEEKLNLESTNFELIEKFIEEFKEKQNEIQKDFEITEIMEPEKLFDHFSKVNYKIQNLQKFYSNATVFLRIYDRKVCQAAFHILQEKIKELESRLLPKKKFGFKSKTHKTPQIGTENRMETKSVVKLNSDKYNTQEEECGFSHRNDEVLSLTEKDIQKKDVLLSDIRNCEIKLFGNPSTLHITNIRNSKIFCGPVSTSIFVENVSDCVLHLACQQLRVHETSRTDFFIHVTSKAIIEDTRDVRFGVYQLDYDGIEEHYKSSGLKKTVNNWDQVDDFNWLAVDKPSPNWSKMLI